MIGVLLALCLWGCAKEKYKAYDYCAVESVVEQKVATTTYGWIAHCADGSDVIFPRVVKKGDGIYFSAYYENDNTVTVKGYIEYIEQVIPQ